MSSVACPTIASSAPFLDPLTPSNTLNQQEGVIKEDMIKSEPAVAPKAAQALKLSPLSYSLPLALPEPSNVVISPPPPTPLTRWWLKVDEMSKSREALVFVRLFALSPSLTP